MYYYYSNIQKKLQEAEFGQISKTLKSKVDSKVYSEYTISIQKILYAS